MALLVLIVMLVVRSGSINNYCLYLKDGEICYNGFSGEGGIEISTRLLANGDADNATLTDMSWVISEAIAINDKTGRIFYPDKLDSDSCSMTLYYRDINNPDEKPVKIDSDIIEYKIDDDASQIVYIKGSEAKALYWSDFTDKEKISSSVCDFFATDDLKKIGYLNDDNNYYLWSGRDSKEKVASDVSSIEYVSKDMETIFYTKNGSLYRQDIGGTEKAVKIAPDISTVIKVYESGEVYYTRENVSEVCLMDYVNDDMASADSALEEPQFPEYPDEPEYPYWLNFDTDEEYDAAQEKYYADYEEYMAKVDELRDNYDDACSAYSAKERRDNLRKELQDDLMEVRKYTLYYFDGKDELLVTDEYSYGNSYAEEKPVLVVQTCNRGKIEKVNLSEIDACYDVRDSVEAAYGDSIYNIVVGPKISTVGQNDASNFRMTPDGSVVYFMADVSDGYGNLYEIKVSDGKAVEPEVLDCDVSISDNIRIMDNGRPVYYKNVNSYDDKKCGDLYFDKSKIDTDVCVQYPTCIGDSLLYYADWNEEKKCGKLKLFDNGEKTTVADDVHDCYVTSNSDILYLNDYSLNHHVGTLYFYDGEVSTMIDDDVAALIRTNDSKIKHWRWG